MAAKDNEDQATGRLIIYSGMSSIIYHLFGNINIVEVHEDTLYYLNMADEGCMGMLIIRLLYVYYTFIINVTDLVLTISLTIFGLLYVYYSHLDAI